VRGHLRQQRIIHGQHREPDMKVLGDRGTETKRRARRLREVDGAEHMCDRVHRPVS
jgi:hypothetical protein